VREERTHTHAIIEEGKMENKKTREEEKSLEDITFLALYNGETG
jgi:hypothetical protein